MSDRMSLLSTYMYREIVLHASLKSDLEGGSLSFFSSSLLSSEYVWGTWSDRFYEEGREIGWKNRSSSNWAKD